MRLRVKIEREQKYLSDNDLAGNWTGVCKTLSGSENIFSDGIKYFTRALYREISPNKNCFLIDLIQAEVTLDPGILEIITIT